VVKSARVELPASTAHFQHSGTAAEVLMKLVEISVSNTPVAGKYLAQAFFEHEGREY
jgi:hypothetical protein